MPDTSFQQSDQQQIALALAALADEIRAVERKRREAITLVGQDPTKGARAVAKIDAELQALKQTQGVLEDAATAAQESAARAARQAAIQRAEQDLQAAIDIPRERVQTAAEFDAALAQLLEVAGKWRAQSEAADARVCAAMAVAFGNDLQAGDQLATLRPRSAGTTSSVCTEVARGVRQLIEAMGLSDAIGQMVQVDRFGPARGGECCLELAAIEDANYLRQRLEALK